MKRRLAVLLVGIGPFLVLALPASGSTHEARTVTGVLTYHDTFVNGPSTAAIRVQMASGQAGILGYTDIPAGTVTPESANGCNGRVCIHTVGSGLTDERWNTTAQAYYSDGTLCPDTYFWTKPPSRTTYSLFDVHFNNHTLCHRAPVNGSTVWTYTTLDCPCTFVNQTKQCNAWEPNPPLNGFPCVTVHS